MDFRDLWRAGSGLTLRRLNVLLRALPRDSALAVSLEEEHRKSLIPTEDKIRARQAHYDRQRGGEDG